MGIKYNQQTLKWEAFYCKRHPVTKKPHTLRRVCLETKREALKVEKDLVVEMNNKFNIELTPSWKKVVEEYYSWQLTQDVSIKTAENYYLCLNAHTVPVWGEIPVNMILGEDIRRLISEKLSGKSPSHQKNILKYIRGAFNYALEKGVINKNPTPLMKFKVGDKIKKVLTIIQVKTLLTQARIIESEWYPIWVTALYTGMRNGELYALTWDKVNLEERKIVVDSAWNNKDGFKCTKSGDDRIVEIAPELLILLKERKLFEIESKFVLPRIDTWDKGEQARDLRMFLQGLGLPMVRFHDLRATWCTLMLQNGIQPIKVMKMGGWKNIATMEIYIRKAGVDINGITNTFELHSHCDEGRLLQLEHL